jgi:hypothetical protein
MLAEVTKTPKAPGALIAVDKQTIQDACRRDSSHCMIAEAIKDRFPKARYVSVDVQTIRFSDLSAGFRYTYLTPRSCQKAIVEFDQGMQPSPFSFQLINGAVTKAGNGSYYSIHKKKILAKMKRARLIDRKKARGVNQSRVGGKTPPRIGTRREFGIKAYAR